MSFEQQLISWRRELHQNPELSLQEVATTARIRDWLQSVELEGTLRTHSSEVQQRVKARVSEIAAGFASAFGAQIDVFWYAGPTALVNDPRWADFASEVAAQAGYRTHHADLHLGGEDFAVYLQHIPGAFVSIGSASEYGLHHPAFNPDERLIAPAAHYFARLAEEALQHI